MLIFQLWSVTIGILLLGLAWRTRRFIHDLMALENLPEHFRLASDQASAPHGELWPKISMIIPACNEAETIEAAMKSVLKIDYPNLEVIIINDRSTDQTGKIIDQLSQQDSRIKPVHLDYLPPGWLGKVHALERGVSLSTAEWILITDADVHFAQDALKRAVTFCLKDKTDFLTLVPDIVARSALLHVTIVQLLHQASLFLNLRKINDPSQKGCYGQGAFMLFRRSTYLRSEGLEWLKMEVVDDTGVALMMRRAGARMAILSGRNQIQLEWYPGFKAFLRGIEKNSFAFQQYSLGVGLGFFALLCSIFFGFTVAPQLAGHWGYTAFAAGSLAVYVFSIHSQLKVLTTPRWWTAFAFPVTFVLLQVIFLRASILALRRGGISWRGTFYDLKTLKANQRLKVANLVLSLPNEQASSNNSEAAKPVDPTADPSEKRVAGSEG